MTPKRTSHTPKKQVLIVDDHSIVVEGITSQLKAREGFEVVGAASDGPEAIEKVKVLHPDMVILDVSLPRLTGIEATYRIKGLDKKTRIVIYSMHAEPEYIISAYRAGVEAYVLKDGPISDLILALETIKEGGTFFCQKAQQILRDHMADLELEDGKKANELQKGIAKLSNREKEVFPLLADGMSIRDIADRLCISPKTVETHKYNIMEKLNVISIAQLTKIAIKKDLIQL